MIASDSIPQVGSRFAPWQRYLSYVPLYGLALPLVKSLEATGHWPHIMARMVKDKIAGFGGYEPAASDVIVCSYMKSGTNWMLQQTVQIAHRGAAEFRNIHDVVPWPDLPPMMDDRIIGLDDPSPLDHSPTGLRVIKTHLPASSVPYTTQARYVVVVRDPKDACVSAYHFFRSLAWGPLAPSVATWVDYFLSPEFHLGSWVEHLHGYWQIRERQNVCFLTFEEMKARPAESARRVAELMDVQLSEEEFNEVLRRSSFEYMKQHGSRFDLGQIVPWGDAGGYMIRRGKRGGSGELLTEEMRRLIDDHCRAELRRLGCDFPYDETFSVE